MTKTTAKCHICNNYVEKDDSLAICKICGANLTPPPTTLPNASFQKSGSTAALVCGILSIVFCALFLVGVILGIIATALATKDKKQGRSHKGALVTGVVGLVLSLFFTSILLISIFTATNKNHRDVELHENPYTSETACTPVKHIFLQNTSLQIA